ncbi:MAG TPA: glycosyltransferase family 4 protein, partial [Thermoanaerobaculia bacterium]|nr:glycosyltransferase family 4 protein [Thermoanaerobaculia bacterium]
LNQSRIAEAYAAADCLVLPSDRGETWGLVVNEAMVCGLPAVTSDQVGCAPDLIRAGETGWSYPCGDVAALASLLRRVAGDPGRSRTMGAAARELVRTRYGVADAVEGTLAALRFVTGRA